jgi:CPA1 family monovalent cation:H+ antiporter
VHVFESLLALLLAATLLSIFARRYGVPYPTLLALGGALLAFVPGAPRLDLPPDLTLALFVAPVLLDAAYDASLRDLRRNWIPVSSLVLVAVGLTTVAVAFTARWLFPEMPWAAAVALGALLAPPDAVAALAVLRQVEPPHRMRVILEGESLLNDASALLIYRLAVGAVAAGGFSLKDAAPAFALVFAGSVLVGWLAAFPARRLTGMIEDAPSSVILQFVMTFALWLLAERLELSGVVTLVVFGLTLARRTSSPMPARLRIPSFAIWETATVVLNVLAFTLVGLQLGPIWTALGPAERWHDLLAAVAILGVVIVVRIAWVFTHHYADAIARRVFSRGSPRQQDAPSAREALAVGWSGMRGIVTLAAALAVPAGFPERDAIQLTAFVVVLGTLVLQGLTLRPLLRLLALPKDDVVETELRLARKAVLKAAMGTLDGNTSAEAERLRQDYTEDLGQARLSDAPHPAPGASLRRRALVASRASARGSSQRRDHRRRGLPSHRGGPGLAGAQPEPRGQLSLERRAASLISRRHRFSQITPANRRAF